MFKYSKYDVFPVLMSTIHFAVLLTGMLLFDRLSVGALVALGIAAGYLHLANVNSFGHHFIHTPFFKWDWVNALFSLMNSFNLGTPQESYRVVHLRHHAFNNDIPSARKAKTKDWHSIYRFGRNGAAENVFTYAIFAHLRMDMREICQVLHKQRRLWRTAAETIAWLLMVAACAWWDWRGVAYFYLPILVIAWPVSYAQNYYEHLGAIPGDRHADAVSSYGRWYNLLWFNNGYHQEHHFQPAVHWTEMPRVREKHGKAFAEHGLRVLQTPHLFAFFERCDPKPRRVGADAQANASAGQMDPVTLDALEPSPGAVEAGEGAVGAPETAAHG